MTTLSQAAALPDAALKTGARAPAQFDHANRRTVEIDKMHLYGAKALVMHLRGTPIFAQLALVRDAIGHTFYVMLSYQDASGMERHVDSHVLDGMYDHDTYPSEYEDITWTSVLFAILEHGELDSEAFYIIELTLEDYWAANPDHAPALSA